LIDALWDLVEEQYLDLKKSAQTPKPVTHQPFGKQLTDGHATPLPIYPGL
jgi:hypothetical protein